MIASFEFKPQDNTEITFDCVNRFEIIKGERLVVAYKVNIIFSIQDNGKTLKLFVMDENS